MRLKDIKIKTRLWLGFSAIFVMVLLLGGMAFWHTGLIWKNTDYLYQHPFKVNIAVREIQTNIFIIQRDMKNVALAENQEELNAAVHSINVNESEIYRLFDTIYALYLGKKSTIDTAMITFRDWKPVRDETIRLSQAGEKREAIQRTKTVGEEHVLQIISKMNILENFAQDRAFNFYKTAEKARNQLYVQLWVLLLLILVFSIFVFSFIMRGITFPIRELVSCVEHYGNGRYHVRNKNNSTNELGVLAAALNRLAETVQFDTIVKNGILEIADVMLANDEKLAFCQSVVDVLMLKTNSNLGAIFFLNETNSMFEPYFSCGFIADKLTSFSADSKEGEFGTLIQGKTIMKVTRIPDDSVFVFSTVAGSVRPKEILAIPVIRRNRVIAMVSLASIELYSNESLEIVRLMEKNLNMSVNAILAFERIREYAHTLDKQNEKLNSQTKELQVQTSELVEQNRELEMQKHQIDEANRLKSQFLSSMSHELRTPLNSVIALSGVLYKKLKNKIPDEEYSYLEIIGRNGKNLLALINDILDLSRIESGKTDIHFSTFPLREIVQHIVVSLQAQVSEKNIVVKNLVGTEMPMITSDSDKCHHVLQNIITNAVKFTDSGSVEISATTNGKEVVVSVKDTGIGIPADQLPYIFDEFRQVDGTTSKNYGGTGLGLAIADKFARNINARIEVVSEPSNGSVFSIYFPVEPPAGTIVSVSAPSRSRTYPEESELPGLQPSEASSKTILLVEDSDPAIIQMSWILREQGYRVEIARNGFQALAAVKVKIPDAIVLDLMMPGMDGFEVLEKIRGTRESATIPVLILTAMYLTTAELSRLTENHIHQLVQKGNLNKYELLAIVRQMLFPPGKDEVSGITKHAGKAKIKGPATILIVDDNPDNGMTLKVLLQDKHTVFTARDGLDGIAMAKSVKPDLILLDIALPGLDGFRVFDELRKEEMLADTPIIAVTAKAMKGDREQILAYGFDGYISKPLDPDLFEETISNWII